VTVTVIYADADGTPHVVAYAARRIDLDAEDLVVTEHGYRHRIPRRAVLSLGVTS
jgi:hypothetical protein